MHYSLMGKMSLLFNAGLTVCVIATIYSVQNNKDNKIFYFKNVLLQI
jgi:hypothetical protein